MVEVLPQARDLNHFQVNFLLPDGEQIQSSLLHSLDEWENVTCILKEEGENLGEVGVLCATGTKKAVLREEMGCSEPENRPETHLGGSQACFQGSPRRRQLFTAEIRVPLDFFFHLKRKRWFTVLRRNRRELLKFHLGAEMRDFESSVIMECLLLHQM